LPQLGGGTGLDAPRAGLELQLEGVAEQLPHVLGLEPLAGVGVFDELPAGAGVRLRPRVLRPCREDEPSARTADAGELCGNPRMIRREDRAEGGDDAVELRILVGKPLAISLVEPDLEPIGCGCLPRLRQL